jgi:hypothetical protein
MGAWPELAAAKSAAEAAAAAVAAAVGAMKIVTA